MQKQGNRRTLRLALAGAAALAVVAAVVVWFFPGTGGRIAQNRPASTTPAWMEARHNAQIAALEKRLGELNRAYADADKKVFLLHRKLRTQDKGALAQEVEDARRAVENALNHHPAILALHQKMDQAVETSSKLSHQQAVIITQQHALQKQHHSESNQKGLDLFAQLSAARQKYLESVGKDAAHLTPEEAKALVDIQSKYVEMAHEVIVSDLSRQPDDTEKQLAADLKALWAQRNASDDGYTAAFNDIPVERARLRAEDPAIAALDRILIEKNARLMAAENESPDLAPLMQQLQAVSRERAEVTAQLMKLRRPVMAAPATTAAIVRTNG